MGVLHDDVSYNYKVCVKWINQNVEVATKQEETKAREKGKGNLVPPGREYG